MRKPFQRGIPIQKNEYFIKKPLGKMPDIKTIAIYLPPEGDNLEQYPEYLCRYETEQVIYLRGESYSVPSIF
jgi:hypothetical protein